MTIKEKTRKRLDMREKNITYKEEKPPQNLSRKKITDS